MGAEVALIAGATLLGGVASGVSSSQKNKSSRRAAESAKRSAAVRATQIDAQAEQQKKQRIAQARRVLSSVVATSAESGFAVGSGDVDSIITGAGLSTNENLATIEANKLADLAYVQSQADAQVAQANSMNQDVLFGAIQGAIGGVSTGLTLLDAAEKIDAKAGDEP